MGHKIFMQSACWQFNAVVCIMILMVQFTVMVSAGCDKGGTVNWICSVRCRYTCTDIGASFTAGNPLDGKSSSSSRWRTACVCYWSPSFSRFAPHPCLPLKPAARPRPLPGAYPWPSRSATVAHRRCQGRHLLADWCRGMPTSATGSDRWRLTAASILSSTRCSFLTAGRATSQVQCEHHNALVKSSHRDTRRFI